MQLAKSMTIVTGKMVHAATVLTQANVDVGGEDGNPGAVVVRLRYAAAADLGLILLVCMRQMRH